jgi:hypothetical protein
MNDSAYTAALVVDLLIAAVAYVWMGLALSALFRKAGERGWKAWVPFLNIFVLLELGGLSGWNVLLLLIPVLGAIALFVILIVAFYRINHAFGFGGGMTVLAALLTLVWFSVLGWGSARWLGGPGRGSLRTANADLDARLGRATDEAAHVPLVSDPVPSDRVPSEPERSDPEPSDPVPSDPVPAAPAQDASRDSASTAAPEPAADPAAPDPAFPAPVSAFAPSPAAKPTPEPTPQPTPEPTLEPAPAAPVSAAPDEAPAHPAPREEAAPVSAAPRPAAPAFDDLDDLDEDMHFRDYSDSDSDDPRIVGTTSSGAPAPGPRRAPISSVPSAPAPAPARDPWARPSDLPASDTAGDTSGEISAVAGAPALGGPMSARSSVSAQRNAPEVPEDGFADETIVAPRRRPRWVLTPPLGAAIPLTSDVVIVGRRPADDPRFPGAQLVPVADETRTMSKTHARLERRDDAWLITDLASTNGVALLAADGAELEVPENGSATIVERFLLGDAELHLTRTEP